LLANAKGKKKEGGRKWRSNPQELRRGFSSLFFPLHVSKKGKRKKGGGRLAISRGGTAKLNFTPKGGGKVKERDTCFHTLNGRGGTSLLVPQGEFDQIPVM